jgi:hypothetical protein
MISKCIKIIIIIFNILPRVRPSFVVVTSVVVEFLFSILFQEEFHLLPVEWVSHFFSQIVSNICNSRVDGLTSWLVDALPNLVEVTREEILIEDVGVLEAISNVNVLIVRGKHNHRCN